jgi:hypothetical protein
MLRMGWGANPAMKKRYSRAKLPRPDIERTMQVIARRLTLLSHQGGGQPFQEANGRDAGGEMQISFVYRPG